MSPKNKWLAFLLCLFLGPLGIHRFYVGKVGTGILFLLTAGICGIGWIVDLVTILTGGFRDVNGQFLRS
jgi:TM2 domain-containing membrane protein YozV